MARNLGSPGWLMMLWIMTGILTVAAALSYALLHLGHRVGLLVFGERVRAECPRGRGAQHYAALARLLSTLEPAPVAERSALGACTPGLK